MMYRTLLRGLFLLLIILAFFLVPLSAATVKDQCREEGIIIKNLTMIDLWYKKNSGECSIWIHNHILRIKPEDRIDVFSDMACTTLYCKKNPAYKDYKSLDANGDCRVRILPRCTLADM
jgi:hypothetical protein